MLNECGNSMFSSHLWIVSIFMAQLLLMYLISLVGSNIRIAAVIVIMIINSSIFSSFFKPVMESKTVCTKQTLK